MSFPATLSKESSLGCLIILSGKRLIDYPPVVVVVVVLLVVVVVVVGASVVVVVVLVLVVVVVGAAVVVVVVLVLVVVVVVGAVVVVVLVVVAGGTHSPSNVTVAPIPVTITVPSNAHTKSVAGPTISIGPTEIE